ncbi:Non-specific protein-tyrosine kinase [Handroanthus impetiginosus]|uniref:Non-specific protein-tyrosine kinase n=1 Tax=Handroanthus impetiginosus TaxID=429701 RepID=A0A2G9H4H5_9LAMI|nr:Non-specific protein-tyrosine kinase [Handroanthus impetiginosus]
MITSKFPTKNSSKEMNTTLARGPLLSLLPKNSRLDYKEVLPNGNCFSSRASSFKCRCLRNEHTSKPHEGFSVLKTDIRGDIGSVWSSMGFYLFSIHIPLSFGGLSAAAKILHRPVLNPQVEAFLILGIQALELSIVLWLLKCPGKPQYDLSDFLHANKSSEERSWLLASLLGFGLLLSLVFITSYLADTLMGHRDVNNPILKEILSSGSNSITACILVYCIITPLLEEVVYRGFLVTSLASKMKWQQAVTISSIVFSASHLSGEDFLQLFIVGFVLGCSYCWTGKLNSSIVIHSLYNAVILFLTYIS